MSTPSRIPQVTAITPIAPQKSQPSATVVSAIQQPQPTPNVVAAPAIATEKTSPTCSADAFSMPTALRLFGESDGLTTRVDTPAHYRTTTDGSVTSIIHDIANCAADQKLLAGYQATTAYTYNWTYYTEPTENGFCRLAGVKVGMHIQQFVPDVQLSSATSASDRAASLRRISDLLDHENSHVALDISYATTLQQTLSALRENCTTIIATADSIAQKSANALVDSNQTLDDTTHHGTR